MKMGTAARMVFVLAIAALVPALAQAASCVGQAELSAQDRAALSGAAGQLLQSVFGGDTAALKTALQPAEASAWESIRSAVEQSGDLLKNGHPKLRNLYLLDASMQSAPADTQFFCTSANGALTVSINMPGLPPGKYAVILADAEGAPLAGQIGLILAEDAGAWKLAGLSIRPGSLNGHDGVWYWSRARTLAQADGWTAFYLYEAARSLLLPVDFLGSPNLDKLRGEQQQVLNGPQTAFPYKVPDGDRTWKVLAVLFDASLRQPDLAVMYESTGVTDSAAQRTEAIAVLSAFLKTQPGLRSNFHGLWAVASTGGKTTPVMELPMEKIP
jgi:hypothetical protein